MKARKIFFLAILILIFSFSSLIYGDVPQMINYQGKITTPQGALVDTTVAMTFTIYDSPTDGETLWTETQDSVVVENGFFSVLLGSVNPIPDSVFDGNVRYLGVKVGNDAEMTPRKEIVSVGYAFKSEFADTADYARAGAGDNDWTFRITDTADTTLITGGAWGIARYGNTLYGNADSTHVNLGVACTTGKSGQNFKYCTVGGGNKNTAGGKYATVGGGFCNIASGSHATVGGGYFDTASGLYSTVGGGYNNTASIGYATVGGGILNTASGLKSTIGGGEYNLVQGNYSSILGGYADTITSSADYSYLFGIKSKLTADSTFMVDMPHIRFGDESNGYEFPTPDGSSGQVMATDGSGQLSWTDVTSGGWNDDGTIVRLQTSTDSVGIGTTTPSEKLDVSGNVRASGTIISGSSIIIDGANDKITATGGTIDFEDENIQTSGNVDMGGFKMATGAGSDKLLTSDAAGNGTWQDPAVSQCADCDDRFVNVQGPDSVVVDSGTAYIARAVGSANASQMVGIIASAENLSAWGVYGGRFKAVSDTGASRAIWGEAYGSSSNHDVIGIWGFASNTSTGDAKGLRGFGINSFGGDVYGGYFQAAPSGSGTKYGVYGEGYGESSAPTYGSYGYAKNTSSGDAYGGYFEADSGGVGLHYGIRAKAYGNDGAYGVAGEGNAASGNSAVGCRGMANNTSTGKAYGGMFTTSDLGTGRHYGVLAEALASSSAAAYGLYGYGRNSSTGEAYGSYCYAKNTSSGRAYGGFFETDSSGTGTHYGVHGQAYSASSAMGCGVYGEGRNSSTGIAVGVYGQGASNSSGDVYGGIFTTDIAGTGTRYGVYGWGWATLGNHDTTYGVYGYGASISDGVVYGGSFRAEQNGTGAHFGISGTADGAYTAPTYGAYGYARNYASGTAYGGYFWAGSEGTGTHFGVFGVEAAGGSGAAVYAAGDFAGSGAKCAVVRTTQGNRLLSVIESPEVWFEDFGEGQLINGQAHIELDPLFLETVTINASNPMKVFVQLNDADCKGTAVIRGTTGFEVVELDNGTSNASFSYRLVAKRRGYEDQRLKQTDMGMNDPHLYPELLEEMESAHRAEQAQMEQERQQMEEQRAQMKTQRHEETERMEQERQKRQEERERMDEERQKMEQERGLR